MAMKVRQGDTVQVIAGRDRGKRRKVQRILPKEHRAVVEGVNMVKRHFRPRPGVRQAGIVQQEAPIHISNLKLVCDKCDKAIRVGFRILEDGTKARVCRSCNEVIG